MKRIGILGSLAALFGLASAQTRPSYDDFPTIAFRADNFDTYPSPDPTFMGGRGHGYQTVFKIDPDSSTEEKAAFIREKDPLIYAFVDSNGYIYDMHKQAHRLTTPGLNGEPVAIEPFQFDSKDGWPILSAPYKGSLLPIQL